MNNTSALKHVLSITFLRRRVALVHSFTIEVRSTWHVRHVLEASLQPLRKKIGIGINTTWMACTIYAAVLTWNSRAPPTFLLRLTARPSQFESAVEEYTVKWAISIRIRTRSPRNKRKVPLDISDALWFKKVKRHEYLIAPNTAGSWWKAGCLLHGAPSGLRAEQLKGTKSAQWSFVTIENAVRASGLSNLNWTNK